MKKTITIMMSLFLILGLTQISAYKDPKVSKAQLKNATVAHLDLQGMTCDGCIDAIKTNVYKLDGVLKVVINLKKKNGMVYLKKGSKIGEKEIRKAVKKAGFNVTKCTLKKKK